MIDSIQLIKLYSFFLWVVVYRSDDDPKNWAEPSYLCNKFVVHDVTPLDTCWIVLVVSGLQPACSPDTTPAHPHLTSNLQQTKNETTNVVINIIVAKS